MADYQPTLGRAFRASCRTWKDKVAQRYPKDGGWHDLTYTAFYEKVRTYAAALLELGLKRGDRVAIQCESRVEWAWTDWACQTLGVVPVPIYPTLPADQTQYIIKDSEAKIAFVGSAELAKKSEGMPNLRVVQLVDGEGSLASLAASGKRVLSDDEWDQYMGAVAPDDLATIIYTSGTTGQPKGAMLTQEGGPWLLNNIGISLPISNTDTFLTYLPISHVFERVVGQWLPVAVGGTSVFSKGLMSLGNDIKTGKPTIMLCVPRFLEAMRDKIVDGAKKKPPLQRKLFEMALSQGLRRAQGKFAPLAPVLDSIVGKKVREGFGGSLRFFVSGGAALPPHTAEFYMAFRLVVLQGYGLTETMAATCFNHPDNSKYWTVGEPIQGVEVKVAGDGEILVRGKSVMTGYFNLPEATAEALDGEGWFHTGDIGEWEGKHLKITDRKKDILVLANGKNIAPQQIENRLRESPWIGEAVLFGDGSEYVYGLIIPNFDRLKAYLKEHGVETKDNHEMAESDLGRKLIQEEVAKVNKTLADFERVKRYAVVDAAFSVETGELTPSLKVKRKVVKEKFASALKDLT